MEKKAYLKIFASVFFAFVFLAIMPQFAQAASLYFSPPSGSRVVGTTLSVSVYVSSADQAINAVSGVISFPSDMLEVVSLSKTGSIFSLWVQEPTFSNSAGTVNFEGIVLNPGFTGAVGKIITVNFRVKAAGQASLAFSSGSVLSNDGKGTNILGALNGGTYVLKNAQVISSLPAPKIQSLTHPDSQKWYPFREARFQWNVPVDASYVLLSLSRRENSIPQVRYAPPISEKTEIDLAEGVWYLHVQFGSAAGLGPIGRLKFQIDATPPKPFSIVRVDDGDPTNPQPQVVFETSDAVSGIARYEMKIGDGQWFDVAPALAEHPMRLPLQAPGDRTVAVRAFDLAGNVSVAELPISIAALPSARITSNVEVGYPATDQIPMVSGFALPGAKITVYVTPERTVSLRQSSELTALEAGAVMRVNEKGQYVFETIADGAGNFSISLAQLPPGQYTVYAFVQDARGALSDASNQITIKISGFGVSRIVEAVRGYVVSFCLLLYRGWMFVLAGLIAIILGLFVRRHGFRFMLPFAKLRYLAQEYEAQKEVYKENRKLRIELRMLEEDIKKELVLLEKIEKHRGLHPDEQYLKAKLQKYQRLLRTL